MTTPFTFTGEMPPEHAPLKLVVLLNGNYYAAYVDAASVEAFEKIMDDNPLGHARPLVFRHSGGYLKFRPSQVDGWYVGPRPDAAPINEQLLRAVQEQVEIVRKQEWRKGGE